MSELTIEHIHIAVDKKEVVSDVSLAVRVGELHVLMGANGSGKSTLASSIMGHPNYAITAGKIKLDGEDITNLSTDKKAQKGIFLSMQYLPEIQGVTLSNFLYRAHKAQKGETVSILDFRKKLEDVATTIGVNTSFLDRDLNVGFSGGEKKLSEMLQLAVLEPTFAILDELDSGVDVDGLSKIIALVKHIQKQGVGIILITHNPAILAQLVSDKVHVMRGGTIVQSGGSELIKKITQEGFESVT